MSDLFSKNYFEIFDLPKSFGVDVSLLKERNRELQKQVHPDRFAHAGEQQSRMAVQMASLVNQAFDTLLSPVSRAQYLLKLAGLDIDHEQDTTMDPMFLMEQMELREAIEGARAKDDPLRAIDKLLQQVKTQLEQVEKSFEADYQSGDLSRAHEWARKMQFLNKNKQELDDMAVAIEDELLG